MKSVVAKLFEKWVTMEIVIRKALRKQSKQPVKLRASMLLETLIAMVIVMSCFGVGISIYANVTNADNTRLRLRAGLLLQQLAAETVRDKSFVNSTTEAEPLRIVKIISPWNTDPAIQQLQLEAWDADGNKISELTELIAAK